MSYPTTLHGSTAARTPVPTDVGDVAVVLALAALPAVLLALASHPEFFAGVVLAVAAGRVSARYTGTE